MTCMLLRVCEMTGWSVGEDWGPRGRGHDAVWGGGRLGGRRRPRPWPRRCVGWRTPWWEGASEAVATTLCGVEDALVGGGVLVPCSSVSALSGGQ